MDNFLSGGVAELEQAKEAILDEARKAADSEAAERAFRSLEKDVAAQKKYMTDKIDSSVKSRRNDLEKSHDEQIQSAKRDLKSARKERRDARTEAVNERVSNETAELVAENGMLKEQIRALFRQWKIPGFANTGYYYAMFATRTAGDFVIFAITVLLTVGLIPNLVCFFLKTSTLVKVLVYVGIVVLFVLIYLLIFFWTKAGAKAKIIERARPIRKKISAGKKKIKKLSKNIRGDGDDTSYGLDSFDSEIERCSRIVEEKEAGKTAALAEFDEHTANAIKAEIESENLPVIEEMEVRCAALKEDMIAKQAASQSASANLAGTYGAFLGTKNATPEKIDELIKIINSGQASTIMQAIDCLNGEIKTQQQ